MLLAREIVTSVIRTNSDYTRTDILGFLDIVYGMIMGGRWLFNRDIDPSTGKDYKIEVTETATSYNGIDYVDFIYESDPDCPVKDIVIYQNTVYYTEDMIGKKYYIRRYKEPKRITSETIDLDIPREYYKDITQGVKFYIEGEDHGSENSFITWKENFMQKMKRGLNRQARGAKINGTKGLSTTNRSIRQSNYC